jgi:hypothetical protein
MVFGAVVVVAAGFFLLAVFFFAGAFLAAAFFAGAFLAGAALAGAGVVVVVEVCACAVTNGTVAAPTNASRVKAEIRDFIFVLLICFF